METPFELVALDDDRAGDLAVGAALVFRTDVDEPRAGVNRLRRLAWTKARQPRARLDQQTIEAAPPVSPRAVHVPTTTTS